MFTYVTKTTEELGPDQVRHSVTYIPICYLWLGYYVHYVYYVCYVLCNSENKVKVEGAVMMYMYTSTCILVTFLKLNYVLYINKKQLHNICHEN